MLSDSHKPGFLNGKISPLSIATNRERFPQVVVELCARNRGLVFVYKSMFIAKLVTRKVEADMNRKELSDYPETLHKALHVL